MKRIIAAASSLGMALSMSLAVPMPAQAETYGNDIAKFCQAVNDANPSISVGKCVSANQTGAVNFCKFLKEIGVLDAVGASLGNCVSFYKTL